MRSAAAGPRFHVSTVTSNQADTPASRAWVSLDYRTVNAETITAHITLVSPEGGTANPRLLLLFFFLKKQSDLEWVHVIRPLLWGAATIVEL